MYASYQRIFICYVCDSTKPSCVRASSDSFVFTPVSNLALRTTGLRKVGESGMADDQYHY